MNVAKQLRKLSGFCVGLLGLVVALSASAQVSNDFSIMNGEEAPQSAYPWFVSLGYTSEGNALDGLFCGGSLIHEKWILTAAHCVSNVSSPSRITATVGRHRLSDNTGERITALRIIVHPAFDSQTFDSDLALVELSRPVSNAQLVRLSWPAFRMTNGAATYGLGHGGLEALQDYLVDIFGLSNTCNNSLDACLNEMANRGQNAVTIVANLLLANGLGDPKRGIGYPELVQLLAERGNSNAVPGMEIDPLVNGLLASGLTLREIAYKILAVSVESDELRQVMLPLLNDSAQCASLTGSVITPNMFCAGYGDTAPKDTCQGDSGGPQIMTNAQGSDWVQVGIISFGPRCGTSYGSYTRIANFLDWIGGIVPMINIERVFNYAETAAATTLKPLGNERSFSLPPYWARFYPASNTGIGSSNDGAYFYDGSSIYFMGALTGWLTPARAAGF